MKTFFNADYLENYLSQKAEQLLGSFDVGKNPCDLFAVPPANDCLQRQN